MNLVICRSGIGRISRTPMVAVLFSTVAICMSLVGCSDEVVTPSAGQLMEFENAGPLRPTVDMNRLIKAKIGGGPYKVINGDVLEITMPALLRAVTYEQAAGADGSAPYMCRISEGGVIDLPLIGQINVGGMTLAQIESAVISAYYPAYSVTRPYVFVRVSEYRTAQVSITGAVNKPGIYSLRSDQMSLVALLMEAGGIIGEGAAVIKIIHADRGLTSDGQATVESDKKLSEKVAGSLQVAQLTLAAHDPPLNWVAVQLAFEPLSASSTVGTLKVTRGPVVLLVERLDVASKEDRLLLLCKLVRAEPRVSIPDVDANLRALAEQLSLAAPPYNNKQHKTPSDNPSTNPNPSNGLFQPQSVREHPAKGESQFSGMDVPYLISPQVAPRRLSYSSPSGEGGTENGIIFARIGFYADTSGESSTASPLTDRGFARQMQGMPIPHVQANSSTGNTRITSPVAPDDSQVLVLPMKGLNIPFTDVVLHDGDSVIVERLAQPLFSVMGLVNRAGNFPYPPDVQYNLMQALAFAGGLDQAADPRYATIYRLKQDGTILHAIFQVANIKGESRPEDAFNIHVKPGDVVIVEHTPRTETKLFLERVFNVNFGAYVPVWR